MNMAPLSISSPMIGGEIHPEELPSVSTTRNDARATESVVAPARSNPPLNRAVRLPQFQNGQRNDKDSDGHVNVED